MALSLARKSRTCVLYTFCVASPSIQTPPMTRERTEGNQHVRTQYDPNLCYMKRQNSSCATATRFFLRALHHLPPCLRNPRHKKWTA